MQWNTTIALTFHFEAGDDKCDLVAKEIASDIQRIVKQAVPRALGLDCRVGAVQSVKQAEFDNLKQHAVDAQNHPGSLVRPFVFEQYPDSARQMLEAFDHRMQGDIRDV